jgi:hypothetical protein
LSARRFGAERPLAGRMPAVRVSPAGAVGADRLLAGRMPAVRSGGGVSAARCDALDYEVQRVKPP